MQTTTDWSAQQLAEFLALVSSAVDEPSAIERAVERAAEAVEAEIGAMVADGSVICSIGFGPDDVPEEELRRATVETAFEIAVPGVGLCPALAVSLDESERSWLVLARAGSAFSREEASLVRGMVRVLSLTLRMLDMIATERHLRTESQRQGSELRDRQRLIERLFDIQRLISSRAPLDVVFDAIVNGAATLFGDEVIGLRLLDDDDPAYARLVASVGIAPAVLATVERTPVGDGVGGRAIAEGRLVVANDYQAFGGALQSFVDDAVGSAMGAPVTRDGTVVGSLVVASRLPDRLYGRREQAMLSALAEHVSLALNDASARRTIDRALGDAVHQATHDALTGLPNRSLALDRLEHALARAGRSASSVAVLFVDLDRFKLVNDSLGHGVGDELLIEVARRLTAGARSGDTVARLAGDEFVVICEDVEIRQALLLADRLSAVLAEPLSLYGRDSVQTASIGVALSDGTDRADELLRDADVAMYRAKEKGRSRIEVFDAAMRARMLQRIETEQALRRAIHAGELRVDYQPIFSLTTQRPTGVEALVRWQHPDGRLVPPDEFIPLAEETGLIVALGAWVLRQSCADVARWRRDHPALADIGVAVNLSGRQFGDPGLVQMVTDVLAESGLPPGAVTLEITETVLMEEAEATIETLLSLKSLGVRLSVDDFGTGYSSLSYLRRFPVDALKIDRSFVQGLTMGTGDTAIVTAVIGLANALGLNVVAEGVEDAAQLRELSNLGCDAAQGYLLGRPQPGALAVAALTDCARVAASFSYA